MKAGSDPDGASRNAGRAVNAIIPQVSIPRSAYVRDTSGVHGYPHGRNRPVLLVRGACTTLNIGLLKGMSVANPMNVLRPFQRIGSEKSPDTLCVKNTRAQ